MRYKSIKNLKNKVAEILRDFPETRNSDISLTIELWKRYYPTRIKMGKDGDEGVYLKDLFDLPREDEIGRARRKIQEKGSFLPTDEKVAIARKLNMDEWRVAMGYPTRDTAGTPKPSWTPPSEQREKTIEECSVPLPFPKPVVCDHVCTSDCRKTGCHCACGEFHLSDLI